LSTRDPAEPRDLLSLLRTGDAPPEIRAFAARGMLPLDADDQMRALLAVIEDPDADTAARARAALGEVSPEELSRFVSNAEPTGIELDVLARRSQDPFVLERIIRNKNVADQTLEQLAHTVTGAPQDALIVNHVRLLKQPSLIDALFANENLTADGRRRLNEIREEFFEKEERRKEAELKRLEEERAAGEAEVVGDLTPEEQAEVQAAQVEDGKPASLTDEEFKKFLTGGLIHRKIATMTVSEKIKLAYAGGKEERRILIADANKLVGAAVLKSRGITLPEIESICQMRHLSDDIFRTIAARREWIRKQPIILALAKNPKVPLGIAMPLVKHLPLRELRLMSRDPNLAEGLRLTAYKLLVDKRR
jgi:hypothetical protein